MLLECAVNSVRNDVIDFVVSCLFVELFNCGNHKNPAYKNGPTPQLFIQIFSLLKRACVVLGAFCKWLTKVLKHF